MSDNTDRYDQVAALLGRAGRAAATRADDDPDFPSDWGQAELAIQLAATGLPEADTLEGGISRSQSMSCLDLVGEALTILQEVSVDEQRPQHTLDLAYVDAALRAVLRAVGQ